MDVVCKRIVIKVHVRMMFKGAVLWFGIGLVIVEIRLRLCLFVLIFFSPYTTACGVCGHVVYSEPSLKLFDSRL